MVAVFKNIGTMQVIVTIFKKTLLGLILIVFTFFGNFHSVFAQTTGAILNRPNSVFISGDYAYITSGLSNALEVVDISNPAYPLHKGSISHGTDGAMLFAPSSVFVSGNYAYVTSSLGNALEIIDVSDPANPKHKNTLYNGENGIQIAGALSVIVSGNYAYVVARRSQAIEILDITDPINPIHASSKSFGSLVGPSSVFISGNYLYVTIFIIGQVGGSLQILDISNPVQPVFVGGIDHGTDGAIINLPDSIFVSGNYAYITSVQGHSLEVVDISNPSLPIHAGKIIDGEGGAELLSPRQVYVSGNYAYVATFVGNAIEIIDISNPANPTHAGKFHYEGELSYPNSVSVSGDYAYVTLNLENAFDILDVSDPANPVRKSKLRDGEINPNCVADCFSNVLFLPGLGGSRLYRPGLVGEDRLWEPNSLNDIPQLGLSSTTYESNNIDIYARGIVDQTFFRVDDWPGTNTYENFIDFMDDEVVGVGIIREWETLSYDWRNELNDILTRGTVVGKTDGEENISYTGSTSTPYILQELRRLARSSRTGKVTLLTHSNGGLLAKELLRVLEATNDPLLEKIDKLILVASPQVGTPEAIAALLHGTTKIAKGTAREFSENMPAAYHLLPSRSYFTAVTTPTIAFSDDIANVSDLADLAGSSIADYDNLIDFMTGRGGRWNEPNAGDIDTPNVVKEDLLNYADGVHDLLDGWIPPSHIEVIQIAGVGIKTVGGIEYDDCDIPFCADTLNHLDRTILETVRGDGTVVVPSALWMSTSTPNVERYYVDIDSNNTAFKRNRDHASILEIDSLQKFLKNLFQGDRIFPDNIILSTEPAIDDVSYFDFRLHSPVQAHLYDASGNHTGLIQNPDPSSEIRLYEKNIPNSYYREFGEVKYAGTESMASTTLVLQGEELGTFTLEVDTTLGDTVIKTTVFNTIPVTAISIATMDVQSLNTIPLLLLDVNGDGTTDTTFTGGEGDAQASFEILTTILETMDIQHGLKKDLTGKLRQAQKELARQKPEKTIKKLDDIIKKLEEEIKKNIKHEEKENKEKEQKVSTEDARVLIEIVERLQANVVK